MQSVNSCVIIMDENSTVVEIISFLGNPVCFRVNTFYQELLPDKESKMRGNIQICGVVGETVVHQRVGQPVERDEKEVTACYWIPTDHINNTPAHSSKLSTILLHTPIQFKTINNTPAHTYTVQNYQLYTCTQFKTINNTPAHTHTVQNYQHYSCTPSHSSKLSTYSCAHTHTVQNYQKR